MDIYFFIDDSGVLDFCENEDYFLYCGYMIIGKDNKNNLIRKYTAVRNEISKYYPGVNEIKGNIFNKNHKFDFNQQLRLYKVMNNELCYPLILRIDNKFIYKTILNDRSSKIRYKNFALKLLIKNGIQKSLNDGVISDDMLFNIRVLVDEEGQATNGLYSLEESIKEELFYGIINWNYANSFNPILTNKTSSISVTYCDSKNVRPVQTADILANLCYFFLHQNYGLSYFSKNKNCIYLRLPF